MNNYLKQKLEEKNMSQSELARRTGFSRAYISELCLGKRDINRMSLERIGDIALALDMCVTDFVRGVIIGE